MKEIILFGAGNKALWYTRILSTLSVKLLFFADNNQTRWGEYYCDLLIQRPDAINNYKNAYILITCQDENGIKRQLEDMKAGNRLISISELQKEEVLLSKKSQKFCSKLLAVPHTENCKWTAVFDNFDGKWGGAEDWVHKVASEARSDLYETCIYERAGQPRQKEDVERMIIRINSAEESEDEAFQLTRLLYEKMPFILVNNWGTALIRSAALLKTYFPDKVKIITIMHNDYTALYEQQTIWQEEVDLFFCVSSQILSKLQKIYHIPAHKTLYHANFTEIDHELSREYARQKEAIRIGYTGRLEVYQKRTDLLERLIRGLEDTNVLYELNIAGSGEYEDPLKNFVKKNGLEEKVHFCGQLLKDKMPLFYEKQDIYINISDFEGMSLSMLEAMSCGCVPVVTNVSGVNDLVKNKKNGLIFECGDIEGMVKGICYLDQHRSMLKQWGEKSRETVQEECDSHRYIEYFKTVLRHYSASKIGVNL